MRIASLISAGTEMLFALGLGEQVVAVSHECDWPVECGRLPRATRSNVDGRADSLAIDRQVRELTSAGLPLYEVDGDLLARLQPDLIVTQSQCDVCAVRYQDVVDVVRREPRLAGTEIISLNPQSVAEVMIDMLAIGAAASIETRAKSIVDELHGRIERVEQATAKAGGGRQVPAAIIEWRDPLLLAGNWVPELLTIAGGRCALTPCGQHSRTHAWNELATFDPEVVIVCPCGFDLQRAITEADLLAELLGWSDLAAVRQGRVYAVDGNAYFNRPGPRLVDSLELLAGLLHPEQIAIPEAARQHYSPVLNRCKKASDSSKSA